MVDLLKKHQNAYTDISIQPAEHIKTLINEIGYERILFGTDYPFVTQAFSILSVLRPVLDNFSMSANDFMQSMEKPHT